MKKALLKFFIEEDKSLCIKIKCSEEEGESAPRIGIGPNGSAVVSVDDFEIDYENCGKLWFNQLDLCFISDEKEETKLGEILVKVKDEEDGLMNVIIKPLD